MKDMKKKALFVLPLLAFVIVMIISYKKTDEEIDPQFTRVDTNDSLTDETMEASNETSDMAVVDIKGEVDNPGIYEVGMDKRVDDVLNMAGGLTKNADVFSVNLAEKVYDEMVIIVSAEGEKASVSDSPSALDKVRINQATQEEIETLSGIGPSKAQAIIQYREDNGPFKKLEDLLEVSGIGEKTLEELEEDILIP